MQIEIPEHTELERGIDFPLRIRFGYGNCVDVVEHNLHCKKAYQKADSVEECSGRRYTFGSIPTLRDVVVESDDRPCQVQRRIENISEIVAEAIVFGFCGSVDSVSF